MISYKQPNFISQRTSKRRTKTTSPKLVEVGKHKDPAEINEIDQKDKKRSTKLRLCVMKR